MQVEVLIDLLMNCGEGSLHFREGQDPPERGRDQRAGRYERSFTSVPYTSTRLRRSVGRPSVSDIVSKDIIIVEIGREKIPTRSEKPDSESSGRIISGFDKNRNWDPETVHNELSKLLTGEMEEVYFEIVKNCGGTLQRPNLPREKKLILNSCSSLLHHLAIDGVIALSTHPCCNQAMNNLKYLSVLLTKETPKTYNQVMFQLLERIWSLI